jgi:oligopeptide/dipeptide ABC transporter ATP-binding protein
LLAAIPVPDPDAKKELKQKLGGDVPNPIAPPPGCRFHTRCPHATDRCRAEEPEFTEIAPGHFVACFLYDKAVEFRRA